MDNEVIEQEPIGTITHMTEQNNEQSVGQLLKQARENKSLSLDAISRHTKINTTNLLFLESDDISNLPNIAYVKGFVKSYARIVGLDQEIVLKSLDRLYNIERVSPDTKLDGETISKEYSSSHISANSNSNEMVSKDTRIKVLAFVVILIIGAVVFINRSKDLSSQKEEQEMAVKPIVLTAQTPLTAQIKEETLPPKDIEAKESDPTSNAVLVKQVETIEKKKELKTKEKVKKATEPAPVTKSKETKAKKVEAKGKKEEIKFYAIPAPLYTIAKISDQERSELIPKNYLRSNKSGKQNVFIRAVSGDSWLTYKIDNGPVRKYILKKGRYTLFTGDDVRIFLGNVHVTKVFINNKLLKIKSKSGVKSLVFPKENAKNLRLPLFIFKKDGTVITSEKYLSEKSSKN